MWLPEPSLSGWSWVTLGEMLDHDEFDRLVESVARETGVAVVGFGVFDEDSAYLAAASARGIECRLVFDHEAFDGQFEGLLPSADELARGGPEAFAAWSASFAPEAVAASTVEELCESPDVDPTVLLQAAGLYPEPKREDSPTWESWYPREMSGAGPRTWDGGGHSHLEGDRVFAILPEPVAESEGPPGPWILLLASDVLRSARSPVQAYLTFVTKDKAYDLRGRFDSIEDAERHFGATYHGREIDGWKHVPEEVGRNRSETITWLVSEATASN